MKLDDLQAYAKLWLAADPDPVTRCELEALLAADDQAGIDERFAQTLRFGTAGVRGVSGPGPNRMNCLTVRLVTAGIASVLTARVVQAPARGVVVAFDARLQSAAFAKEVCGVLAGCGIRAIAFPGTQPTPLLAFSVLHLQAAAGIMLTASHNPPEYHGLKVYWENGVQILAPIDEEISLAIAKIPSPAAVPLLEAEQARRLGLLVEASPELESSYVAELQGNLDFLPEPVVRHQPKIVYTPLHGVGARLTRAALRAREFENLSIVSEQEQPDGRFPTISDPNPENTAAFELALARARQEDAALVLVSDPDGDRLAVAARDSAGTYHILSGDQIGALLGHYILESRAQTNSLPPKGFVVTTVVSSALLERISSSFGVRCEYTLTGFKWMWNQALQLERQGWTFLFGYEEAIGYSTTRIVRDKDAVAAAALLAELQRSCETDGRTLLDRLDDLYLRFGVSCTRQISFPLPHGWMDERGGSAFNALRESPPDCLAEAKLVQIADLRCQEVVSLPERAVTLSSIPKSDLILLKYNSGLRIAVRPSGTEPKLKLYFEVILDVNREHSLAEVKTSARNHLEACSEDFGRYLSIVLGLPGVRLPAVDGEEA